MLLTRRATWLLAVPVALVLVGYVLWPNLATFRLGIEAGERDQVWGSGTQPVQYPFATTGPAKSWHPPQAPSPAGAL